jgi:hypothetical protein
LGRNKSHNPLKRSTNILGVFVAFSLEAVWEMKKGSAAKNRFQTKNA